MRFFVRPHKTSRFTLPIQTKNNPIVSVFVFAFLLFFFFALAESNAKSTNRQLVDSGELCDPLHNVCATYTEHEVTTTRTNSFGTRTRTTLEYDGPKWRIYAGAKILPCTSASNPIGRHEKKIAAQIANHCKRYSNGKDGIVFVLRPTYGFCSQVVPGTFEILLEEDPDTEFPVFTGMNSTDDWINRYWEESPLATFAPVLEDGILEEGARTERARRLFENHSYMKPAFEGWSFSGMFSHFGYFGEPKYSFGELGTSLERSDLLLPDARGTAQRRLSRLTDRFKSGLAVLEEHFRTFEFVDITKDGGSDCSSVKL